MRILCSPLNKLCHIRFAHTKLIAAGHPKENLHLFIQFLCTAVHQIKLLLRLRCEMLYSLFHRITNIFIFFIYTGEHDFLHFHAIFHADMKFSRRAHFITLHFRVHGLQKKWIGLNGKTELCRLYLLRHMGCPGLQNIRIKYKGRCLQ